MKTPVKFTTAISVAMLALASSARADTLIRFFDDGVLIASSLQSATPFNELLASDQNFSRIDVQTMDRHSQGGLPFGIGFDMIVLAFTAPTLSGTHTLQVLVTEIDLAARPASLGDNLRFENVFSIGGDGIGGIPVTLSNFVNPTNAPFAQTLLVGNVSRSTLANGSSGSILQNNIADAGAGPFGVTMAMSAVFSDATTPPGNYALDTFSAIAAAGVPEPSTWAMMLIGFAGLGFVVQKRRQVVRMA